MDSRKYPTLNTDRLTLRQLTIDDQQDIFALRSDPEINRFLERAPAKTIEDAGIFINQINSSIEKGDAYYWAISFTDSQKLVGTNCLFDLSCENRTCEIGYELMPTFQGQGIMKEAMAVVIDFVFNTIHFNQILASTHHENLASANLLTGLNFLPSTEMVHENPAVNIFSLLHSA
jgi:ribosomal-protein-alanine N-acetyltransferase